MRTLEELTGELQALRLLAMKKPDSGGLTPQQKQDAISLIGALAQPLIGGASDPVLTGVNTGLGTVTDITFAGDSANGISVSGGTITTSGTVNVTVGASLNVSTSYKVAGTQVVGARGAAVADATDAASVITQLNAWLARARAHGLIS